MKYIFGILFFIFLCPNTYAQNFDVDDFNEKKETVGWLYEYDLTVWVSTEHLKTEDSIKLKQLGREWFCFQDDHKIWHAVYGNYENGKYNQVFHFIVDSSLQVKETYEQLDPNFLIKFGQALSKAFVKMDSVASFGELRFNHFIKENKKGNLEVFIFPAYQPDGTAVYGGEFIYEISAEGEILKDESYLKEKFLGFTTDEPREIWLNYNELKKPTLGSVFFVWYYKDLFAQIYIDNLSSYTTLIKSGEKYHWTTVEE